MALNPTGHGSPVASALNNRPSKTHVAETGFTDQVTNAINDSTHDMPQLIVRKVEDTVVKRLKARAGRHGVSMEEEHRRILREALQGKSAEQPSFKAYLLKMPENGPDKVFERVRDKGRRIAL
jgi:plasmid stability protein